jgi:cell wall-associated NlpC family hydrolase
VQIDVIDLLSVPYKKNGRDMNGFDCYGLVLEVCNRFGHKLKDFKYTDTSYKTFEKILKEVDPEKEGVKLAKPPFLAGDIILFITAGTFENHCGVYLGDNQFIHCDIYGVHVQDIDTYFGKVGSVYRWL